MMQATPEVQQQNQQNILQSSSHPTALVFLLLFRVAAIVIYVFGWIVTSSFILQFVTIVLMLAFDFWTVKNVSGRLLVGLRWWNEIKDDGSNEWIFESKENRAVNSSDSRIFWAALYIAPVVWIVFAVLAILQFKTGWFLLTFIAISMSMANVIGYSKCEKAVKVNVGCKEESAAICCPAGICSEYGWQRNLIPTWHHLLVKYTFLRVLWDGYSLSLTRICSIPAPFTMRLSFF